MKNFLTKMCREWGEVVDGWYSKIVMNVDEIVMKSFQQVLGFLETYTARIYALKWVYPRINRSNNGLV